MLHSFAGFQFVLSHKTVYICGDFKIDQLHTESHYMTQKFVDIMLSAGVYSLVNKQTHISETIAPLIDNILTNYLNAFVPLELTL